MSVEGSRVLLGGPWVSLRGTGAFMMFLVVSRRGLGVFKRVLGVSRSCFGVSLGCSWVPLGCKEGHA